MSARPLWSKLAPLAFAFAACLTLGGQRASAQSGGEVDDPQYGSTYGRLRYFDGSAVLERAADGTRSDAALNDPIAAGDRLATGDGRAEIALSDGGTVWLDRDTRLDVRNLADVDDRYESTDLFALESGALRLEAPERDRSHPRTYRVDTEAGSLYLLSNGTFRIESDGGVTTVYSFAGVAELSGDEGSVLVRTGERSSVQAGRAPSEPRRFNTARLDDFDRFCEGRSDAYLHPVGETSDRIVEEVPYEVQPYVQELSYYGSWHQVPSYGWVWRPVYEAAWNPYVYGSWAWYPTGWVWVSSDPWGWAPYRYGRWDYLDIGWVWIPGTVWSGAWVSFAVGPTHIGWCPLNYYNRPVFQDVTIVNVTNVNVSRLHPRGWRFVPVDQFANPRGSRTVIRSDRLPRGTDVVLTSSLPRFNPREAAAGGRNERFVDTVRRTRSPLPVSMDPDNRPQSFRSIEQRGTVQRGVRAAGVSRGAEKVAPRQTAPRSDTQARPRITPRDFWLRPQGQARSAPAVPRGRTAAADPQRPTTSSTPSVRGPVTERRSPPTPVRPPQASPNMARPRAASPEPNRLRVTETPRPSGATGPRPGDQALERLFDGVRGQSGRQRTEMPRPAPPQPSLRIAPPQATRPQAPPPRVEHPPQQDRPSPRAKPKEGGDRRGH